MVNGSASNGLAELVRTSAAAARGSVVADRRSALPLADVVRRGEEVAREVAATAGRPHPVVAVVLPSSVEAVTHLVAAVLGDHTVTFLDPSVEGTDTVLEGVGADVVVDGDGLARRPGATPAEEAPHRRRGGAGYVARSSGTTGSGPKGVLTTWGTLADFAPHGADALQLEAGACWAEPNHPAYDLAITNWLLALATGASLHVSASLTDRLRPLALAARTGATHVRLAPRYVDLAVAEARRGARPGLRVWGSGGDRLSTAHARLVLGLGVRTLVNTYGTSETAGFASAAAYDDADGVRALDGVVSVGRGSLGPWALELVADDHAGTGSDLISVRSPHVGEGYLFGGDGQEFPRWQDGRVVTGDLGAEQDGDLFCFGRVGRLVKRSATFVNLDDVDTHVRDLRGLAACTVLTRGGALVTLVETRGGTQEGLGDVREDLAARVAPVMVPDAVVGVAALPRLGNGKTDQAGVLVLAERALEQVG